ncbi:hypothetical protein [Vogesella indigofera]|uniref:hypothetical protein n=1 Tax=Vogesella indigofera TaxID=45465 RepID=UPI00403291D9
MPKSFLTPYRPLGAVAADTEQVLEETHRCGGSTGFTCFPFNLPAWAGEAPRQAAILADRQPMLSTFIFSKGITKQKIIIFGNIGARLW